MKSKQRHQQSADIERRRQSTRLQDWDYAAPAAYFVTICAYRRELIFGNVVDDQMAINDLGQIVEEEWSRSAEIRKELDLDAFVVMPNHLHGIVIVRYPDNIDSQPLKRASVGAHGRAPLHRPPRSLGSFIAGFKARATRRINEHRRSPGKPVWQRGYYDHIIRNDDDLHHIRNYIRLNPLKWALDPYYPKA